MSHNINFHEESEDSEDEIEELFSMGCGKKRRKENFTKNSGKFFKKKKEKKRFEKRADIAMMVEEVIATLASAAEEDAELNRQSRPAVNKLKKLPLLIHFLLKRGQVQWELLDHGILGVLKIWLEPLTDGSLPNLTIRNTILDMLVNYPIDLKLFHRRDQLRKSGLGKAIQFLSRSLEEETTSNRRLAKNLVKKWSSAIFDRCSKPEDYDKKPAAFKPVDNPEFDKLFRRTSKSTKYSYSSQRVSIPEPSKMNFSVRPQSKVDSSKVRAPAKLVGQNEIRPPKVRN